MQVMHWCQSDVHKKVLGEAGSAAHDAPFLYAKRGVKVRFWCENFPSAPLRGGGCSAPSAHAYMTPPRSEKNGFEPGFEPPFWDILADLGGRPALKRSLLADRNNPTVEWEADVF